MSQETNDVTSILLTPAIAMANLYMGTSHALCMAAHNATLEQQRANTIAQALTVVGVLAMYKLDTTIIAADVAKILLKDLPKEK